MPLFLLAASKQPKQVSLPLFLHPISNASFPASVALSLSFLQQEFDFKTTFHNFQCFCSKISTFLHSDHFFSLSLNILIRVTPGALQDEKSAPIIQRLNSAQNAWATLKELISTTTWSAGDQYIADIQNADKQSEDLLKRMNEIVLLYEEAAS